MALTFRNLTVSPEDPVEAWGFEGLMAAVDRGDLGDWRRIARAVRNDPWGEVALTLDEVFALAEDSGAVETLRSARDLARRQRETEERQEVARTLARHLAATDLSQAEFARRLGTSPSRFSTYLSGKVVPSATMLVRAEHLARESQA